MFPLRLTNINRWQILQIGCLIVLQLKIQSLHTSEMSVPMNDSTAYQYLSRLDDFKRFIAKKYNNRLSIDNLLIEITKRNQDPYDLLNGYAAHLRNSNIPH